MSTTQTQLADGAREPPARFCEVHGKVICWHDRRRRVCDAWDKKHVPTAWDKALAKLTADERRALGL